MREGKFYFIGFLLLALNIFVFKAQNNPIAKTIQTPESEEQAVREYANSIINNFDDFDVVCGDGIIMENDRQAGGFGICYYSEKDTALFSGGDNLVMIYYHTNKNSYRNHKIYLFNSNSLQYYNERNYQERYSLEIFFDKDRVTNAHTIGYPFVIDINEYAKKIKQDLENEDFHDSIFDFYNSSYKK